MRLSVDLEGYSSIWFSCLTFSSQFLEGSQVKEEEASAESMEQDESGGDDADAVRIYVYVRA